MLKERRKKSTKLKQGCLSNFMKPSVDEETLTWLHRQVSVTALRAPSPSTNLVPPAAAPTIYSFFIADFFITEISSYHYSQISIADREKNPIPTPTYISADYSDFDLSVEESDFLVNVKMVAETKVVVCSKSLPVLEVPYFGKEAHLVDEMKSIDGAIPVDPTLDRVRASESVCSSSQSVCSSSSSSSSQGFLFVFGYRNSDRHDFVSVAMVSVCVRVLMMFNSSGCEANSRYRRRFDGAEGISKSPVGELC